MNQYFTIMFAFLCGCVAFSVFRYKFILVLKVYNYICTVFWRL